MTDTESNLGDVQEVPHNGSRTAIQNTSDSSHELSEEEKPSRENRPANVVQPSSTTPNPEFPPDRGHQAWLVVAGAWVCFFVSYGFISSAGVYQDYYQRTFLRDYSTSAIAWIQSLQLFALSASAPFMNRWFDGHGPNVPVAVGSFMLIFGMMMQSLSTRYYQLLLSQALCSGIGMGMIFHSSTASVSAGFRQRRGSALGLTSSGSGLRGVIIP